MGTIKILGFDEDGNAQRLKIRIARFLDYDPVTASDKSNIRSTLGITSQGGLGDLLAANNLDDVASLDTTKANLEIPDVGTDPSQVPLNQHLGSMAYQSAEGISVARLEVTDKVDGSLGIGVSPDKPLHVGGAGEQTLRLENTSTALGDGDVVGSIEFEANDASSNGSGVVSKIQSESLNSLGNLFGLSFHTGHGGSMTEKMLLDNDGRLGIGTSSPSSYNADSSRG